MCVRASQVWSEAAARPKTAAGATSSNPGRTHDDAMEAVDEGLGGGTG